MRIFRRKFEQVTPEMIKRCTDDLEFYDEHGYLPYENKLVVWVKKKLGIIK
jgi:hypothetical protein